MDQSTDTLARQDHKFGNLTLRFCKYGWMLFEGPYIGKCFELYGEYSESEVSVFRQYVGEGDVVIDVGANIGDLTLPLARLVGASGRVYAYESHPALFNTLCANLALNQIETVKPINGFVSDDEDAPMDSPVWGKDAYTGSTWRPPVVSLHDLALDRLRLIKIDVDGGELGVLQSAIMLIKSFQPVLYFENDVREKSGPLLEFVFALGYRVFFHLAPIFQPDNFYGNPDNAWAPRNICSLMVLAVPRGVAAPAGLREVTRSDEWWDF